MDPAEMRTLTLRQLAEQMDQINAESQARIDAASAPLKQTCNDMRRAFERYMDGRDFFPVESQEDFDIVFILRDEGMRFKVRLCREPLGDALFRDLQTKLTVLGDVEFDTDEPPRPCDSHII
ncbi:unnamed protein product [Linum trigynum]|uniref:Kinetochore protein SPC25 n=1 Tax=Linum trigynum TaxID=586398 RepID=A0AAV2EJ18_9ROSI